VFSAIKLIKKSCSVVVSVSTPVISLKLGAFILNNYLSPPSLQICSFDLRFRFLENKVSCLLVFDSIWVSFSSLDLQFWETLHDSSFSQWWWEEAFIYSSWVKMHELLKSWASEGFFPERDTLFFFAETFRSFLLMHFGHWNISVICFTVVLKLAITVYFSLHFRTFWPKWLNFFRSFQNRFGLWPKKPRHTTPFCWNFQNSATPFRRPWLKCETFDITSHTANKKSRSYRRRSAAQVIRVNLVEMQFSWCGNITHLAFWSRVSRTHSPSTDNIPALNQGLPSTIFRSECWDRIVLWPCQA